MKNIFKKNNLEGFTLMELLVSTALFVVIAVGSLSILLSSRKAYKRISSNRLTMDNINMVVDLMTREIKFGNKYGCVNTSLDGNFNRIDNPKYNSISIIDLLSNSTGNCNAIAFTPQGTSTLKVVYYYNVASSSINQVSFSGSGVFFRVPNSDVSLTSEEFAIDKLWFNVFGALASENLQPRVDLFISGVVSLPSGQAGGSKASTTLFIESSVTQRIITD